MHNYAKLAKKAAESYVRNQRILPVVGPAANPAANPPAGPASGPASGGLTRQQACYVYLFENPGRKLRAMYGQPLPRYSTLAEEIVSNVTTALTITVHRSLRRPELASIVYTVAVLDPLQLISDAAQLDPRRLGLYVQSDQGKSAVLLPERTGIETPQDQIATALRESGINVRHETARMYRFGVTYYD